MKDRYIRKALANLNQSSNSLHDRMNNHPKHNVAKVNSNVPKRGNLPKLEEGSFLDTYCFVLSSIHLSEVFNNEYYAKCLQQVSELYHSLIVHHGITQGTKK
jgi:hypothetical protein